MTFSEYLEDCLDLNIGLMSAEQIAEARECFNRATEKKSTDAAHPDTKKSVSDLKGRCESLVKGQANAIARAEGKPGFEQAIIAAKAALAEGRRILSAKRPTKAEYIAHAEQNAEASRKMNAVK